MINCTLPHKFILLKNLPQKLKYFQDIGENNLYVRVYGQLQIILPGKEVLRIKEEVKENIIKQQLNSECESEYFIQEIKQYQGKQTTIDNLYGILEDRGHFIIIDLKDSYRNYTMERGKFYYFFGEAQRTDIEQIPKMLSTVCKEAKDLDVPAYEKFLEHLQQNFEKRGLDYYTYNITQD